ncbi:hypothetical protein H8N03_00325 [Ramlibacter sp. USB13]|uniref:Uncharacterized protein n=1 Tax=Ramlibacter cellulosilyticus TaxID=2764187 RepID=A0A923MLS7_9BURK|nr:hypothetical protein [Ramlibacter cellulosilyticus]MBC5781365.1 hypothetical protein [Ramlibacter cellulosilyticus]
MASNTSQSAQAMPAEAVTEAEKEDGCHDKSAPQEPLPPRAGRTGGLGARAERPSEGSRRKSDEKDKDKDKGSSGRGAKAPSANGSAAGGERP